MAFDDYWIQYFDHVIGLKDVSGSYEEQQRANFSQLNATHFASWAMFTHRA